MTIRESVYLACAFPGCSNGTFADPRHLTNICASGGWYCHGHDTEADE